ncbi:glycosyltransferase family 4 protein [Novipirellula sp. SH528]|uniref:glycosyltransferase family 4 protein n=1 Tax=Novipirellula sp. SH528 TaxID=3454466 RepID=UPI003F9FA882
MTLRLLSIGHSYVLGVNRRLPHELQSQSGGRWDVTVVAPDRFVGNNDLRPLEFEPFDDEPADVKVLPARWTSKVHVFYYCGLRKLIRKGNFDLIHAWEEPYIFAGMQIARAVQRTTPLVFSTCQNNVKSYPPPFSWFERSCVKRMAGWTYIGGLVKDAMEKRSGYPDKPSHYLPLGFDSELFQPNRETALPELAELGWDRSIPIIGYLGRLVPEKGLRVLMDALDQTAQPWRLLLVGAGILAEEIRNWAVKYPNRVLIYDQIKHADVPKYLNAMDMLVAPSLTWPNWREQQGRMLIEAFASGVPVIGSNSGEIPFVIGDAGVVVPENDASALSLAIVDLMDDPEKRRRLAEIGLARAEAEFNWAGIAKRTLKFFDRIVDKT